MRFGILVNSIPLIALTPILMVWVGNGLAPRIVLATIGGAVPAARRRRPGFQSRRPQRGGAVPPSGGDALAAAASSSRCPPPCPTSSPALKIAAPLSILGALIAEWVSADRGLGIMMTYALFSFDVPLAWLTILAVCAIAMAAYGAVALVERLVVGPPASAPGSSRDGRHG